MTGKRKDNLGRILKDGESQKADGRYMYQYTDIHGKRRSLYSWRLVETDRTPKGKKEMPPLREREEQVKMDIKDGIRNEGGKITVNDMFMVYFSARRGWKQSTRTNYSYMWERFARETIGKMALQVVKKSDVLNYYYDLADRGLKVGTLEIMHKMVRPTFQMAVDDGYIRLNPANGCMGEIRKSFEHTRQKHHALTIEQQRIFFRFTQESKAHRQWLPLFITLLETGLRIGEALGLRWEDVDFEKGLISVNHHLIYRVQDTGNCEFHVTTPKTRNGVRKIPLLPEVRDTFLQEKEMQVQNHRRCKVKIDGYKNFIFINSHGNVSTPASINRAIWRICNAYNKLETGKAVEEKRPPILLPYFSCHILRHTFCTRFCENETDIKVIQEIMGHGSISVTMDIYAEATMEKKKEVFGNLEGKIVLF